jgi:hypothetical protein
MSDLLYGQPTTAAALTAARQKSSELRLRQANKTIRQPPCTLGVGAPTHTVDDGYLYIDTSGPVLYYRAGGIWVAS